MDSELRVQGGGATPGGANTGIVEFLEEVSSGSPPPLAAPTLRMQSVGTSTPAADIRSQKFCRSAIPVSNHGQAFTKMPDP